MEQKPKLSVTGYRAIWGKDLNEQIAFEYVRSFAKMIVETSPNKENLRVLVGRDARQTGPLIFAAAKEALEAEKIEVVYAGILPTPSMLLLTRKMYFSAGIMITASHNPPEYNGVKFIMPEGRLTNERETAEIERIRKITREIDKTPSKHEKPMTEEIDNIEFRKIHINEVLKGVDVELIRGREFTVCLDPINSGGSIITQELLKELNCKVHVINGEPDGNFAHKPEPLAENLTDTAKFVAEISPDIGFVQDPDADRLVLINERGEFILEELTISLCIKSVLSRAEETDKHENVVVNLSTTQVCKDITEEYGGHLYRAKVGEANVVQKMMEMNAPIGGEGSGGVIYPKVGFFRDSLSGIALILELLAREKRKTSEIVESLPKYFMKKENITFSGDLKLLYRDFEAKFSDAFVNNLDGLRFDWLDSSWIHVRPSNTEPLVRIFGEAKSGQRIDAIFKEANLTINVASQGIDFGLQKR